MYFLCYAVDLKSVNIGPISGTSSVKSEKSSSNQKHATPSSSSQSLTATTTETTNSQSASTKVPSSGGTTIAPSTPVSQQDKALDGSQVTNSATPIPPKRRKTRGPADNTETDDGFLKKLQLKIDFPETLKLWLVDDWDLVTRQSRVS